MIFAVDFDGTLCEDKFPEIGEPMLGMIEYIKRAQQQGHSIILWTCRTGDALQKAVEWCGQQGIRFDAVNQNLREIQQQYGMDTRKVYADYYIDDKNLCIATKYPYQEYKIK